MKEVCVPSCVHVSARVCVFGGGVLGICMVAHRREHVCAGACILP